MWGNAKFGVHSQHIFLFQGDRVVAGPSPETLAPSFGAGKPQHPYIPFALAKSRLHLWVSNRRLCTEIRPLDDFVTGTAHQCVLSQTCKKLVVLVGVCLGLPRGVFKQPSRMQILAFLKCRASLIDSVEIGETNRQTVRQICIVKH